MSILKELEILLSPILPVETGVFSDEAPDEYLVITPMIDDFIVYGDNVPLVELSEVRISLYSKDNYLKRKNQITSALISADFLITERRYIGREDDTGYHHYSIDAAKDYVMEDNYG